MATRKGGGGHTTAAAEINAAADIEVVPGSVNDSVSTGGAAKAEETTSTTSSTPAGAAGVFDSLAVQVAVAVAVVFLFVPGGLLPEPLRSVRRVLLDMLKSPFGLASKKPPRRSAVALLGQCGSGKTALFFRLRADAAAAAAKDSGASAEEIKDASSPPAFGFVSSLRANRDTLSMPLLDGQATTEVDILDCPGHQQLSEGGRETTLRLVRAGALRAIIYVLDSRNTPAAKRALKDAAEHLYDLMLAAQGSAGGAGASISIAAGQNSFASDLVNSGPGSADDLDGNGGGGGETGGMGLPPILLFLNKQDDFGVDGSGSGGGDGMTPLTPTTPASMTGTLGSDTTCRSERAVLQELERELERMRQSRAAALEGQDSASDYIGIHGEKFSFFQGGVGGSAGSISPRTDGVPDGSPRSGAEGGGYDRSRVDSGHVPFASAAGYGGETPTADKQLGAFTGGFLRVAGGSVLHGWGPTKEGGGGLMNRKKKTRGLEAVYEFLGETYAGA